MADAPALDVVIVSYRCRDLLRACVQALERFPPSGPLRIDVVDNDSRDGTVETVRDEFPAVELTAAGANLGFSAATNLGIRAGSAPYVLALNPDTRVTEGSLDRLLAVMEARPEAAVCGPRLELDDGTLDHAARRSFPTLLGALGHFTGVGRRQGSHPKLAQYRAPEVEAGPVDAVNGAFMLMRRRALDEVGLFDEGYWMYMEDLDLSYRLGEAGWVTWYEPSVTVGHVKAGSSGTNRRPRLNYAFHYGMFRFYRKHYAARRHAAVNGLVYLGIGAKLAVSMARSSASRRLDRSPDQRPRTPRRPPEVLVIMHLAEASGPARHLYPWLEQIARRGRVHVAVPARGDTARRYSAIAETTVVPFSALTFPRGPANAFLLLLRTVKEVGVFRRTIRRLSPDAVVVATTVVPSAVIAARLTRTPSVVYAAELWKPGRGGPARSLSRQIVVRLTERFATAIVACSQAVAEQFDRGRVRVTTIYPGLPEADGEGDGVRFRAESGLDGAEPLLAVVGNVSHGRGQDLALRALCLVRESLPRAACAIVGAPHRRAVDLRYREELPDLAEELGVADSVVFTGHLEDVSSVYAAADVVVNPARTDEAFGRVALEAIAAGTPVVSTRVGAVPEVLRDGTDALLVAPERPERLADAVVRLSRDRALRERLIRNGRRRIAEQFREEKAVRAFGELLDEVIVHAPAGRRREPWRGRRR